MADEIESQFLLTPLGWPTPPEYSSSPQSSSPTDPCISSPEYSSDLLPNEVFLAGSAMVPRRAGPAAIAVSSASRRPSPYDYRYKSLTLSLNSKSTRTQSPAYGYGELITGYVEVRGGLKHVDKVELTIEGFVTTTIIDRSAPVASSSKRVLKHVETLYCGNSPSEDQLAASCKPAVQLPISYQLPTQGRTKLPPSFYALYSTMEASVRYVARIDLYKRGALRRNEKVETVLLYLPKTAPPSNLPPSWYSSGTSNPSSSSSRDAKRPLQDETPTTTCQKEWTSVMLNNASKTQAVDVEFCLFKPLVYQAQSPIPLSLSVTSSAPVVADLILASAQATLLKCTTIHVHDQIMTSEEVIGVAGFGKPESQLDEGNAKVVRRATGCLTGGREQGEVAWSIEGMVSVKYAIRLDIKPSLALDGIIPTYTHQETVELTTNPIDDTENFDGALDGPALGIVGRL